MKLNSKILLLLIIFKLHPNPPQIQNYVTSLQVPSSIFSSNIISHCSQIVEYLLDMAEVKVDAHDTLTGETALTVASSNGCHNVCTALLIRGASISAVNRKVSYKLCSSLYFVVFMCYLMTLYYLQELL